MITKDSDHRQLIEAFNALFKGDLELPPELKFIEKVYEDVKLPKNTWWGEEDEIHIEEDDDIDSDLEDLEITGEEMEKLEEVESEIPHADGEVFMVRAQANIDIPKEGVDMAINEGGFKIKKGNHYYVCGIVYAEALYVLIANVLMTKYVIIVRSKVGNLGLTYAHEESLGREDSTNILNKLQDNTRLSLIIS